MKRTVSLLSLLLLTLSVSVYPADQKEIFYDAPLFDRCAICQEEQLLDAQTSCGHSFCSESLNQWFETSRPQNCPVCRTPNITVTYSTVPDLAISDYGRCDFSLALDDMMVAPEYQKETAALINSLSDAEFAAALRASGNDLGLLQLRVANKRNFSDPSISLKHRRILLLERLGLNIFLDDNQGLRGWALWFAGLHNPKRRFIPPGYSYAELKEAMRSANYNLPFDLFERMNLIYQRDEERRNANEAAFDQYMLEQDRTEQN